LSWAKAVFIPLILTVVVSHARSALVNLMKKWRIPVCARGEVLKPVGALLGKEVAIAQTKNQRNASGTTCRAQALAGRLS
jgi:hypothetical protein